MLIITVTYDDPVQLSVFKPEELHQEFIRLAGLIIKSGGQIKFQKRRVGEKREFMTCDTMERLNLLHKEFDQLVDIL